ncbi:Gfo/Idh/MocA family protein [Pseudodesulfovibrio sediminis]|uniref:Dehydrogenase n=1 Tax=Pseudodesulfovibrio sediminis TaxID=2810563 RepID=A0ABN6EY06_9BACT|nr:Gfo/Idh/MocA family oxidoreductase [Pseudodesulfovibrio sediminis]BCS90124.1 dehydrogenase [Pseudodesulfovibrio sediminis]
MLKVAVVGLGWMGRVHLRNYTEMPDVEVVGVVDIDEAILKEVADQFGVKTFTSLDELLENELDAMSICVPTSLHHEVGLKVMDKSINAIIEKPLAVTSQEGEDLVAKAKEKGVALMVGHVERYNPAVSRVKELMGSDDVISIQIERVGPYPPRIQDVGVIKDLGAHDVDLIRFLTGSEFKSVYAVSSSTLGKHEDSALITAEMENGVLANITTNWVTPYKARNINVACESKYIKANLITQEVKEYSAFSSYDQSYSVREWPLMFREPVKAELTEFLTALREGTPVPITGEDGLEVLKTFDKIFECAC